MLLLMCALAWASPRASRADGEPRTLVDWLAARGEDTSFEARRARFAAFFPGEGYAGSAEQNLRLLRLLRGDVSVLPQPAAGPPGAQASRTRPDVVVQLGWEVVLDRSGQILALDAPKDVTFTWSRGPEHVETREEPLSATLPAEGGGFVSAAALGQKAKQFDDGLYAAVESAATNGAGAFPGIYVFLADLARAIRAGGELAPDEPAWTVLAANELGQGWAPTRAPRVQGRLGETLDAFQADPLRSKPLGFYTWHPTLVSIFRRDRMLQTALPAGADLSRLLDALRSEPHRRAVYAAWLALAEGMTNPFPYADLRPLVAGRERRSPTPVRFLPPSRSHETEIARRLWSDRPVPEGASLMDLVVQGVRDGSLSLEPRADSGWYDLQTWSLEPLLRPEATPEAAHLRYGAGYREHLEALFRGLLALTRETHVRQLDQGFTGAYMPPPSIRVPPALTVEPLATSYRRRADGYAFVRGVIERAFGRGALRSLQRMTAGGPVGVDLDTELSFMEHLFRGAAAAAEAEIGAAPTADPRASEADVEVFHAWRSVLAGDPDLARDARMMVPVFHDAGRRQTKVWVFLGWDTRPLSIVYERTPKVVSSRALWPGSRGRPEVVFTGQVARLATPVMAEVYVSELLDRDAFRAHCDRHQTRTAILEHLR